MKYLCKIKKYWKQVLNPLFNECTVKGFTMINCERDFLLEILPYCMKNNIKIVLLGEVEYITESFLENNGSVLKINELNAESDVLFIGQAGLSGMDNETEKMICKHQWRIIINENKELFAPFCNMYPDLREVIGEMYDRLQFIIPEQYVSFLKERLGCEDFMNELEMERRNIQKEYEEYRLRNENAKRHIYNEERDIRKTEVEKVEKEYKNKIKKIKESKRYRIGSKIAGITTINKKRDVPDKEVTLPKSKRLDELVQYYNVSTEQDIFELYYRYSMIHNSMKVPWTDNEKSVISSMETMKERDVLKYSERQQDVKVSIIMPTYNRADVISRAIDSVVTQSYKNWELIIIDDYSTDHTEAIIKRYVQDERIKYILNDGKKGVCGARNKGLKLAEGEYIAYLDSDNEWENDYLLLSVNKLMEQEDYRSLYSAQRVWSVVDNELVVDSIRFGVYAIAYCENRNYIDMNSYIHEKSLYEQFGGFDEELSRMTDWELILRYSRHGYPYAYPVVLCDYFKKGKVSDRISENEEEAFSVLSSKFNYNKLDLLEAYEVIKSGYDMYSNADLKLYGKSDRKVAIIIPNYEALDCLKLCIAAIRKYSQQYDYEIIIVDNYSAEDTRCYLQDVSEDADITVIQNDYNMGFTYAVNQGIKAAREGSDYILLNNDAIVTENWLEELYAVKDRVPKAGLIVPRQELIPHTRTMKVHAPKCYENREIDVNISYHHKNVLDVKKYAKYGYIELSFAAFFLVMITNECYQQLGLLDEINGRHYKSDRLYCKIAAEKGIEMVYTPFSKAYHLLQQSTQQLKSKDSEMYNIIFKKNNWDDLKDRKVKYNVRGES